MRNWLILLSIALISGICQAELFWRYPGNASSVLKNWGGIQVYSTEVEVNGQSGVLGSYSFTGTTVQALSTRLAQKFGLPLPRKTAASAHLIASKDGGISHFFVLPAPTGEDQCVVLAFEQKSRGREKNPQWPDNFPAIAAEPTFSAVCKKTRTALVQAQSAATPQELLQETANALKQKGWLEATPQTSSCRIFTYGRKHCILMSNRDEDKMVSTLTILQREGAKE